VQQAIAGGAKAIDPKSVKLLAPLPNPGKFLLMAGNYKKHVEEYGGTVPEGHITPQFFLKPDTCINNPHDPIPVTPRNVFVDHEAEITVVFGRTGKNIPREKALDYVFGYTVVNDVSERKFNKNIPGRALRPRDEFFDWLNGKWFDGAAPMGPVITTADEIPDPHKPRITTHVNGKLMQDSANEVMIHDIPTLIACLSTFMTIQPGDILSTGTPSGVGGPVGRKLEIGDVVKCEIEGIGSVENKVVGSY